MLAQQPIRGCFSTYLREDNSQWEADGAAESTVAHDYLLLHLDLLDAAQVDKGGEDEGAQESVEEAEHDGGQNEPRVEVMRLLSTVRKSKMSSDLRKQKF